MLISQWAIIEYLCCFSTLGRALRQRPDPQAKILFAEVLRQFMLPSIAINTTPGIRPVLNLCGAFQRQAATPATSPIASFECTLFMPLSL